MSQSDYDDARLSAGLVNHRASRRSVIGKGASAILAGAGMVAAGSPVFAQDATPTSDDDVLPGSGQITLDPSTLTDPSLSVIPPEMEEFANDWPMWQHDYAATRNAVGSTIDSSNVSELGVAWEFKLGASSPFGAMTSNPIVLGDRIYIIDNTASVQCLDRETAEVIWSVEHSVSTLGPNGVAVGYGVLVGVTGDTAEVFALDAETGEEIWRFALSNHNAIGITTGPVIYDGWVLVSTEPGGNTKGTYRGGANGVVYCMDVMTGATLWTWDTVEDDLWGNFRINSGGGLWYPISVDTETGIIYAGVGNAAPFPGTPEYPEGSSRPGQNLYANCLVAIDPKVGKVLWYVNVKPRDLYDHDNQLTPVLATVTQGDSTADVAFTSGKHGYIAAVHRGSGQEIWRRAVGKHQNDNLIDLPPEGEPIEVYPGIQGGVGAPMAFADGVLYAAVLNWPNEVTEATLSADFSKLNEATTELIALDGATGEYIWNVEIPAGTNGPGPTIANDVVFIGTLDGIARGFNTADGSEVWRSQTSAGLNAPFAVAGDMLLVPAGSFMAPSPDSPDPMPGVNTNLIAYKLGATGEVTLGEAGTEATPLGEDTDTLVHVNAVDIAFEPNVLTIAADTDVTISVTNTGVLQHDFLIQETDIDSGLIDPEVTVDVVVNLPAGTYTYYCSISGHLQAGMVGTLTVE